MKTLLTLILFFGSFNAFAAKESWMCKSIDGVGMSYENGGWHKSLNLESTMFEIKIHSDSSILQFPDWMMMKDAKCRANSVVPWVSCSTAFNIFAFNPKTGEAMNASLGLWIMKESLKSKGVVSPPLYTSTEVYSCQ